MPETDEIGIYEEAHRKLIQLAKLPRPQGEREETMAYGLTKLVLSLAVDVISELGEAQALPEGLAGNEGRWATKFLELEL
jgi:hypothetical protein